MSSPHRLRLFAFGCSFTRYHWATWPQILAQHHDAELYNYGCAGAGNIYIFNHIMQADQYYQFGADDIVAVCWTNVCREDRYVNDRWFTGGNIFSNPYHDLDWAKKWADPHGMAIRDYAVIHAAQDYIQHRTNHHWYFSMCDIRRRMDQWASSGVDMMPAADLYQPTLQKIQASFYDVLWNDDITVKHQYNNQYIDRRFIDAHPSPQESLTYLQRTTNIDFSPDTVQAVMQAQDSWVKTLGSYCQRWTGRDFSPHHLPSSELDLLESATRIWPEHAVCRL